MTTRYSFFLKMRRVKYLLDYEGARVKEINLWIHGDEAKYVTYTMSRTRDLIPCAADIFKINIIEPYALRERLSVSFLMKNGTPTLKSSFDTINGSLHGSTNPRARSLDEPLRYHLYRRRPAPSLLLQSQ